MIDFKANMKIQQFLELFKDKMKTHLKTKPKQEVKSFLSNFENLLGQHKDKFWKQAKIDLVEDNYEQFIVFVVTEMYKDELFRCQFFEYVMRQQFNTIEQIRDSIIVRKAPEMNIDDQENAKEETILNTKNHAKLLKKVLDKVVYKLSKPARPNKLNTLQKDVTNQIHNLRDNKRTTDIQKEIIEIDKEMGSRVISILEDLNLIDINTTIQGSPIQYSESINDKYKDLEKYQGIDSIIENRCH